MKPNAASVCDMPRTRRRAARYFLVLAAASSFGSTRQEPPQFQKETQITKTENSQQTMSAVLLFFFHDSAADSQVYATTLKDLPECMQRAMKAAEDPMDISIDDVEEDWQALLEKAYADDDDVEIEDMVGEIRDYCDALVDNDTELLQKGATFQFVVKVFEM